MHVWSAYLEEAKDVLRLSRVVFGEAGVTESIGKGSTLAQGTVRRRKREIRRAVDLFP